MIYQLCFTVYACALHTLTLQSRVRCGQTHVYSHQKQVQANLQCRYAVSLLVHFSAEGVEVYVSQLQVRALCVLSVLQAQCNEQTS